MSVQRDPRITPPSGSATRMQVGVPITGLRRAGHGVAALDHQLVYGQKFDVYKTKGRVCWGQEVTQSGQGYVGYVASSALGQQGDPSNHRICAQKAPMFSKPDLKSFIRKLLPLNAQICVQGTVGEYYQIASGFIHKNHVCADNEKNQGGNENFVSIAQRHLGLPYIWGGVGPDGLDCSGLVQSALRAIGHDCLRDADLQEKTLGQPVQVSAGLKRGDLVFWKGHVGIMYDPKMLLHASGHHMLVVLEPFDTAVQRIEPSTGKVISIKRL